MHCRVVLLRRWSDCSDSSLCSRLLFSFFFVCVLELFIGIVFIVCIKLDLFELLGRHLSGLDGIELLLRLSLGFLLRDRWPFGCDGDVRGRKVLGRFIHCLY